LAAFFPMSAKAALSLSFEMIAGGGKDRLIESLSALRRRLQASDFTGFVSAPIAMDRVF
jgi:hypothetical protein